MENKANYTLVGIFAIFFISAFAVAVFWLGKFGFKNDFDNYRVLATESVSGLNIEAPVKYRGVVVGRVADIRISTENTEQIEILLKIKEGTPIKTSSVAYIKPQGITGLSFVDITPGQNGDLLLRDADKSSLPTIKHAPSIFSKFDSSIANMLDRAQSIMEKLDNSLDEKNLKHANEVLENLSVITSKLSSRLDEIGEITKNSKELPVETVAAIKKISAAADSANNVAIRLNSSLKRGDFDYKKDISGVADEAKRLITQLRELSKESNVLVKNIQKNPSSLLFDSANIPKGPGEE